MENDHMSQAITETTASAAAMTYRSRYLRIGALYLLLALIATPVKAQSIWTGSLDKYGGAITNPVNYCAVSTTDWSVQKINGRWLWCTPLRNPFYIIGIFAADTTEVDRVSSTLLASKYGTKDTKWGPAQVRRFRALGINTILSSSSKWVEPWQTNNSDPAWISTIDSDGNAKVANSQPTKMAAIYTIFADSYPARNVFAYCGQANKTLYQGINTSFYTADTSVGLEDPWDGCYQTWIHAFITTHADSFSCGNSLFCIGFQSHESDNIFGMEAGDVADFPTNPTGHNNPHISPLVLINSPYQTSANDPVGNEEYFTSNRTVTAKSQLSTFLQGRYASIAALNTAWGSNYAGFNSVGVNKVETCGTGNGSTLTFTCTLSFVIDKCSVWASVETSPGVGLTPKGGDYCHSGAGGPPTANSMRGLTLAGCPRTCSSTVNYSTKAVTVNFSAGNAPCNGCAVKLDYFSGGWGNCITNSTCQLLDENGAGSGLPTGSFAYVSLTNTTAAFKADMSAFLTAFTKQFFKVPHDEIKSKWPNKLALGPNVLGSWCTPPRKEILAEAANWMDAGFIQAGACNGSDDQARIDFVFTNWGDHPIGGVWMSVTANPDSYYGGSNPVHCCVTSTQGARATMYSTMYTEATTGRATTSGGFFLIAGIDWWQWYDNGGERSNWGLGTPLDNLYDGVQATTTGGTYTDSVLGTLTGQVEATNFGNFITTFKTKNLNVYNDILPSSTPPTQAASPTASPVAGTYASAQTVALSTTSGGVICWTLTASPAPATNGASGCSVGTPYSVTIPVPSSETIYAVAGGTGFLDSAVSNFAYVIGIPPPPPTGKGAIPPLIIITSNSGNGISCQAVEPGTATPAGKTCADAQLLTGLSGPCLLCVGQ